MTEQADFKVTVVYGYVSLLPYDWTTKLDEDGKRWYGTRHKVTRYSESHQIIDTKIVEPEVWICYD